MRIIQLIILLFVLSSTRRLLAQTRDTLAIYHWFVDKPNTRQDSLNLIQQGFSKINVYEYEALCHHCDSIEWGIKLIATWDITFSGKTITAQVTKKRANRKRPYESLLRAGTKIRYSKKMITEKLVDEEHGVEFTMTHLLNEAGQVYQTNKTYFDWKGGNSRYDRLSKIVYSYNSQNLLTEAVYYGDGMMYGDNNYLKYVFDYLK